MRYRTKELNRSVIVKIDGNAREDKAAMARQALSVFLRYPRAKVILYLAGWHKIATPELGFLEAIHRKVKTQGGALRLCGFRDDLWVQIDRTLPSSQASVPYRSLAANRLKHQELPLKRLA